MDVVLADETLPVVSLLDPPETECQSHGRLVCAGQATPRSAAEVFRHSGWQGNRDRIASSLRRTGQSPSRLLNFLNCGYGSYVLQHPEDPTVYRVAGSNCHDRWCLPCGKYRASKLSSAIVDILGTTLPRFVTLTLRQRQAPLNEQLDRLYTYFRALRRRGFWKRRVTGGGAFTEVKLNPETGYWNVHLHCLVETPWLPWRELKQTWHDITGDSYIVDVRPCRSLPELAGYVAKYVCKPHTASFIHSPDRLDEAVLALYGRKLCLTFGTWRGMRLTANDEYVGWINLGSFNDIFEEALHGVVESVRVLESVAPDLWAATLQIRPPPRSVPSGTSVSPEAQSLLPLEFRPPGPYSPIAPA